jgi:hypothetical protein
MKEKSLDELLKHTHITPRHGLSVEFTNQVMHHLNRQPQQSRLSYMKEFLQMKLITKPAIALAAVVACVAIGGTSYAAVGGWNGIQALFGGEKKVDNARIVTVNTQNCTITSAFNITSKDKQQNTYYYRVINDSKLTNDQIVQMARGECEDSANSQTSFDVTSELNKNPLNQDTVVGDYADSLVTAVNSSSISIESDVPTGDTIKTFNQTFPHIDPQVIVYSGARRLALSDIHVGDHVALSYRASGDALRNSETIHPDKVDTSAQVVVVIAKNSPDRTAAVNYQKYNGKEFEQVTPCSTDASGFCTAEQYYSQKH